MLGLFMLKIISLLIVQLVKMESIGVVYQFGKKLVVKCNDLGIIIDGSHASDKAVLEMMTLSKSPIILSHSGARLFLIIQEMLTIKYY